MKTYKINEIFHSIQGEGRWTGMAVTFIRFSGCNLSCSFCDTEHKSFTEYSLDEVDRVIEDGGHRRVVLTGGEPMLQYDEDFYKRFINISTHIETNGTILIPTNMKPSWITVSPKSLTDWKQKEGDELKVVYQGQTRDELDEYIRQSQFEHYYLQPCSMQNINETIKAVKEDDRWQLSLQTQKILKIR